MTDQLRQLNEEVKDLQEEVRKLNEDVEILKGDNHQLKCDCEELVEKEKHQAMKSYDLGFTLQARSQTIEDLQQYTRRNCVIVSGVPEEKGENTDDKVIKLANEKMDIPLDETDLDRSHRTGKGNQEMANLGP